MAQRIGTVAIAPHYNRGMRDFARNHNIQTAIDRQMNLLLTSILRNVLTAMLALTIVVGVCTCNQLPAQDEDPFSSPFDSPAGDADTLAPTPTTTPGKRPRRGAARAIEKEDPVVLTIQESNPKTAGELINAIMILVDIGKVDLAKTYLDQLTVLEIDDKTMFDLNMKFKSQTFMRMRRVDEFRPDAPIFVRKLFAASDRYARDPDRVASFVSELSDDSIDARVAAAQGLMLAREDAVQPLISALLDESLEQNHSDYLIALARMGPLATEPLQAIVYSDDQAGFIKASQVMVVAKDRAVLPALLNRRLLSKDEAPMETFSLNMIEKLADSRPSRSSSRKYLENELDETLQRAAIFIDSPELTNKWSWDATSQTLSKTQVTKRQALLDRATWLAKTLHNYDENDSSAKRQYWLTLLEARKLSLNPSQSLDAASIPKSHPGFLENVLAAAMKSDRIESAIGAAELLGERGDASLLRSDGGQPRAIVQAAMHANRRLKFAATNAILKWDPKQAYAGSSRVIESAGLLAGTTGGSKVLVVEPNAVHADTLAGVMATIGFEADATNTARQFFKRATSSADYEFAMIGSNVSNPAPLELIQQIRRDYRTSGLPLVIVTRDLADLPRLKTIAETQPNTFAIDWPVGPDSSKLIQERVVKLLGRDHLSQEARVQQAGLAMDGLLNIARHRENYSFYKMLPLESSIGHAVYHPKLGDRAIELLGWLATPDAQLELVSIATQEGLPVEDRKAAVGAFTNAVNRRGILLTKREILRQYERYNASEILSAESQQILASVLDAMENRNTRAVSATK